MSTKIGPCSSSLLCRASVFSLSPQSAVRFHQSFVKFDPSSWPDLRAVKITPQEFAHLSLAPQKQ